MNYKDIEVILKNENYYRIIVRNHFLETSPTTNNEIKAQNYDNSKERSFINKIEDKKYKQALEYVQAINKMYDSLNERQKLVYEHRYKYKMSVERIAIEINYSRDTIWKELKNIKRLLFSIIAYKKY